MASTANKTKFSFSDAYTPDYESALDALTYEEIKLLMEVPELGGAPEKIDITTLSDDVKKYIPGIKDYGDLVFKFLYENDEATSNYRVLKGLEKDGNAVAFCIEYPDGTAHYFVAIPSVKIDSGAINGALTFSATMLLQSDIKTVDPVEE